MNDIVYYPGVWDIPHIGHFLALQQVDFYGKLVVGICSDELTYKHKEKLPIYNQKQRKEFIKALPNVYDVIVYNNTEYDLHVDGMTCFACGPEFGSRKDQMNFLEYCTKNYIRVLRTSRFPTINTTDIINRIKRIHEDEIRYNA